MLLKRLKTVCISFCLATVACGSHEVLAAEEVEEFKLWLGHSKIRFAYETALIKLALNKTAEQYGDYNLEILTSALSSQRGLRMIREGKIHMFVSGDRINDRGYLRTIDIPIWDGLLGYRKLMVHKVNLPLFSQVNDIEELRQFRAGQGTNWTDILIYEANNIEVKTAISFPSMYGMLYAGRFEFLPLGVNEIDANLAEARIDYPELDIVPKLLIRYPLNIYIQVGSQQKQLAKRLEKGLKIAEKDGSWAELKEKYLSPYLETDDLDGFRVIRLEYPVQD